MESGQTIEKLFEVERDSEVSRALLLGDDLESEVYNLETELHLLDRELDLREEYMQYLDEQVEVKNIKVLES